MMREEEVICNSFQRHGTFFTGHCDGTLLGPLLVELSDLQNELIDIANGKE